MNKPKRKETKKAIITNYSYEFGFNEACAEYDKWLLERLDDILYRGMPKPNSFEECSKYYKTEIKKLIEEIRGE